MAYKRIYKTTIGPFNVNTLDGLPKHDYLKEDTFKVWIRPLVGDKIGFVWTESANGSDYAVVENVPVSALYNSQQISDQSE